MVKRLHTRRLRYIPLQKGRHRKPRPKSFTTQLAAETYAKAEGMKNFSIRIKNPFTVNNKKYTPVEKKVE